MEKIFTIFQLLFKEKDRRVREKLKTEEKTHKIDIKEENSRLEKKFIVFQLFLFYY